MIWWLNTTVAKVISRFLKGPIGIVVHYFVMGYIYQNILVAAAGVLNTLPLPVPDGPLPELQTMSPQEIFAYLKGTPILMAGVVVAVVAIGGAFVLQVVGTFKAATIYNARPQTGKRSGRSARQGGWGGLLMGLIGMGCVIGITLLVRPDAVGWVSVGTLLAVGFLSCIRREAAEKKLLKSGINEIDKLTGEGFERFLALYFKAQGYNAKMTPEFGDFGADLILVKDGATTIVQAKRWENAVGIEAVQQIVAAKAYYKAERAMVVTNSAFTPAAIKLAEVNRVELWERSALIERLSEASAADLLPASDVRSAPDRTCLECGRLLVERTGPTGRFRGCSGFPLCTYTSDAH